MDSASDVAGDVQGCLAVVHTLGLGDLLTPQRPVLEAQIRRVAASAGHADHRYSAFGSYLDVPPNPQEVDSRRGRPIETVTSHLT